MMTLAILCPCYNEEALLEHSAKRLLTLLGLLSDKGKIARDSFLLLVDDGSTDATWDSIGRLQTEHRLVKGLHLASNAGHQQALYAGMMACRGMCDAVVTIDVDLQDDLACIEKMVDACAHGSDVVYGVKVCRGADPLLKRWSADAFYLLMKCLGVKTIRNHADFRLLSACALDALAAYPSDNLYLRGLIPQLDLPSSVVEECICRREAGKSKFTFSKMLNFALDGLSMCPGWTLCTLTLLGALSALSGVFLFGTAGWVIPSLLLLVGLPAALIGCLALLHKR